MSILISISIRRLYRDYLRTIFYISIIASLLVSISIVLPLNATINLSVKKFSNLTSTIIKVESNSVIKYYIPTGVESTWFNKSLSKMLNNSLLYFSKDNITTIKNINHVEKIVKGIFFDVGWRPNTEKWHKHEREISEIAGAPGKSAKIYYDMALLGVEAGEAGDFVADFKNILEGRFINPGTNEIVLSKTVMDHTGVKLGDYINIPIGFPPKNYTFHVVGVLLTPEAPRDLGAVVDLNYMLNVVREVYGDVLNKYISDGEFPVYHVLYVKVDSIDNLYNVGNKIMNIFGAAIGYNVVSSSVLMSTLNSFRNIYNIISTALFIPVALTLFISRALETLRGKGEIGLLKAMGWRDRHVLTYLIIQTILIGLLGGLISTFTIIFLSPYIRKLFTINPAGLGLSSEAKAEAYNIISFILSSIPDMRLTLLAPIYGIAIFTLASIFTAIYYLKIDPSEALKEK